MRFLFSSQDQKFYPVMKGPVIPPFYAGEVGRRGAIRLRAGQPVITMNFGQPSAGAPKAALEAARRAMDSDPLGYWESQQLRERLAAHYVETYGVTVEPERILLTAGASAALVTVFMALFRPGDRVAVVRPGYPAYRNSLLALGLVPVEIDCTRSPGYRPTPEQLAALDPAPAGFILASPANPTGAMVGKQELAAFAEVCRERGIQLISDEIYHGITFGERAVSALECDPDIVVVNSFSKLYRMPGWRLGWMVLPQQYVRPVHAYLINLFLTPSALAQHVALAAMDQYEDLGRWVKIYARNRLRLIEGLTQMGITGIAPPDGAFYLYADIGHLTNDSLRFCMRAVDEIGVAMAPGIDFDPVDGHRYLRLSYAISPEEVERAIQLLGHWLPGYRKAGDRSEGSDPLGQVTASP